MEGFNAKYFFSQKKILETLGKKNCQSCQPFLINSQILLLRQHAERSLPPQAHGERAPHRSVSPAPAPAARPEPGQPEAPKRQPWAVANPRQGRAAARAPVPLLKRFQPGTRRRRCREHRACEPGQPQGSGSDSRHRRDGAATDTATGRKGARGVCGGKAAARGAGLRDTAWGTIRLRGGRQGRQEAGGLAPRCQGRPAVRLTPRDNRETLPPGPGSPYSPRAAGRHPESPCSTLSGPLLPLSGPSHCLPRAGPVRQRGVPATHSSGEAQTPAGLSPSGARNGCRAGDRASCDRKRAEAALAGASHARQPEGIHF